MIDPCTPLWTLASAVRPAVRRVVRHAGRRLARHYARHKAAHILLMVGLGCVGGPAALVALLPPPPLMVPFNPDPIPPPADEAIAPPPRPTGADAVRVPAEQAVRIPAPGANVLVPALVVLLLLKAGKCACQSNARR